MARLLLCFCLFGIVLNYNGLAKAGRAQKTKLVHNLAESYSDGEPTAVQPRIVRGQMATAGQFPWQVAIVMDSSYFCGGSIISSNWILTAGHCVAGTKTFQITVGTLFSSSPLLPEPDRQTLVSTNGIAYPGYDVNSAQDNNDIAVVKLPRDLSWTPNVKAIPLPTSDDEFLSLDWKNVTISGWGKTSDTSDVSNPLMYTNLQVLPGAVCGIIYGDTSMDQKICGGSLLRSSTCNGDSGGPLIFRGSDGQYREVGVVNYGPESCMEGIPVVFARVTSFLDFIYSTTGMTAPAPSASNPQQTPTLKFPF